MKPTRAMRWSSTSESQPFAQRRQTSPEPHRKNLLEAEVEAFELCAVLALVIGAILFVLGNAP